MTVGGKLLEMFEDWDWNDTSCAMLVVVFLTLLTVGIIAISADHQVDYYYLSGGGDGASCVYAHWTWKSDEKVWCSTDPGKVLQYVQYANAVALPQHITIKVGQLPDEFIKNDPNTKDMQ